MATKVHSLLGGMNLRGHFFQPLPYIYGEIMISKTFLKTQRKTASAAIGMFIYPTSFYKSIFFLFYSVISRVTPSGINAEPHHFHRPMEQRVYWAWSQHGPLWGGVRLALLGAEAFIGFHAVTKPTSCNKSFNNPSLSPPYNGQGCEKAQCDQATEIL